MSLSIFSPSLLQAAPFRRILVAGLRCRRRPREEVLLGLLHVGQGPLIIGPRLGDRLPVPEDPREFVAVDRHEFHDSAVLGLSVLPGLLGHAQLSPGLCPLAPLQLRCAGRSALSVLAAEELEQGLDARCTCEVLREKVGRILRALDLSKLNVCPSPNISFFCFFCLTEW